MDKPATKQVGLVGLFDNPDSLVHAAKRVRDAALKKWDCHTPYPVHGLEHAMGLGASKVPTIALTAAFTGLAAAIVLTGSLHGEAYYPIRIGGKALLSWQAFVPIYFEMFVLFAAFASMGAVFVLCGLFRWHSPLHDTGVMADITSDKFAIVIDAADAGYDEEKCRKLLADAGCTDIRPLVENVEDEVAL